MHEVKDLVSIIVPLWNHCEDVTMPFFNALMKTKDVNFEVVFENNGSTDNTAVFLERMQKKHKNVRVVTSKINLGFGGGNNIGYAAAKGEYICFLSNDVMIEDPLWLKRLVAAAKEYPKAIYGDMLVTWNQLTLFRNVPTPYILGYLMFAQKYVFDDVKEDNQVFDEDFGVAYFEDVYLSARAEFKGYKLIAFPKLGVNHLGSKSSDQINITEQTKKAKRHFTNRMTMLFLEKIKKKRIVFYFKCAYQFTDVDYEGKGIGGAESALVLLAREFAKNGWQTEIYNTTKMSGTFNGVEYHNINEFVPTDYCDVFVLFREPYRYLPQVNGVIKLFWSCDQYTYGNWKTAVFPYVDGVIAISPYHANYIDNRYGPVKDKLHIIELGVNKADYENEEKKIPGKIIYCSVPHRGLDHLARLWPGIKKRVPQAKLYITSDYRLWGVERPQNGEFISMFQNHPDVFFLGKIGRKDLVYHQKTAEVMAYPCTYEECFCISAMECIAAGAVPVTTAIGAIRTTVGDNGIVLSGLPGKGKYDEEFIEEVAELLLDSMKAEKIRKAGKERALTQYTYGHVYKKWQILLLEIKRGGERDMANVVCENCGKKMPNSFVLTKHMAKHTPKNVDNMEEKVVNDGTQLLRFNVPVEFFINGKKYEGTEIEVEYDRVSSALQQVKDGYGAEAIAF